MTERELRDFEKLKTTEDYINEIKALTDVVCNSKKADKKIDDILLDLTNALQKKYKYIINISKPYTKKQKWFLKLRDKRMEKKSESEAQKEEKTSEENVSGLPSVPGQELPSLPAPSTSVEVLENIEVKQLTSGNIEEPRKEEN